MARSQIYVPLLLALVGLGVGGFLVVRYERTVQGPVALGEDAARASSEVRDALGEPLRFGRIPQAKVRGSNAHLGIRVRGPRGSGVLLEWAQRDAGKWQLCSLLYRDESTTTDVILVSRTTTHCARE